MRIGILTHNYPLTHRERKDAGVFIFDFANALAQVVDKVYIFCPNYDGKKEKYLKTPVTWFNWRGEKTRLGQYKVWNPISIYYTLDFLITGRREVINFIKNNKIDFCLAMWAFPSGVFAFEANRKMRIPYAVWTLGSDIFLYAQYPIIKNLVRLILQRAVLRYGGGYEISRRTQKICGKYCSYLPTATVVEKEKAKKIILDKKKFNFVYLGRLESVKGPDILLEATNLLKRKTDNFHVYFIGGGSLKEELEKKVKEHGLENLVTIFGRVENQQIINGYLKNGNALVIPSRFDSLSLVFSEGIKMKIPIICSDFGDIPRFVRKYHLGFVFRNEDSRQLASLMAKAIRMGKNFKKAHTGNMSDLAKIHDINEVAKRFIREIRECI